MPPVPRNPVMIFAHPPHEVFVGGLLQQYQPRILYLCDAFGANDADRRSQARTTLEALGYSKRVEFLPIAERDVYGALLTGNVEWFLGLCDQVQDWLQQSTPDSVFTDAFEWYNPIHDVCPLLVDSAMRAGAIDAQRFEIPLSFLCVSDEEAHGVVDAFETYGLTDAQIARKRQIVETIAPQFDYIHEITTCMSEQKLRNEYYAPVSSERDYTQPPGRVVGKSYDEHGRNRVRSGKYKNAISFREHYRPLAESLLTSKPHPSPRTEFAA